MDEKKQAKLINFVPEGRKDPKVTNEDWSILGYGNLQILIVAWSNEEKRRLAEAKKNKAFEASELNAAWAAKQRAESLRQMLAVADEKPLIAPWRPNNYFRVGDRVMFLLPKEQRAESGQGESFIMGRIIREGTFDGRIQMEALEANADKLVPSMGCSAFVPDVMLAWEYSYLRDPENVAFLDLWLRFVAELDEKFDAEVFKAVLLKP